MSRKLLKRFYEPLVLQYVLSPIRGNHLPCERLDIQDELELAHSELRRSFVKSLAYLCDFKKGGDTVTAIALQETPAGAVFWVAANKDVETKVVSFLKEILKTLVGLDGVSEECRAGKEEGIFEISVKLGKPRLEVYHQWMQKPLEKCLKVLKSEENEGMISWLSSFGGWREDDISHVCRLCYEAWTSPYMKEITTRANKASGEAIEVESTANNFLKVRHFIGRLGQHMKAAKRLVAAAIRFPSLFDDFEIQRLPSPKADKAPPFVDKSNTLDLMIGRMLPAGHEDILFYQEALRDMDNKYNIRESVVEQYQKRTFLPRVHAELILLEHFYTEEFDFVGGDKYIGCSKPACYLCYHYICSHPGNFVRPASHNKIYLNWRTPGPFDISGDEPAAKRQRDILNNSLVGIIRRDVLEQIKEKSGGRRSHPDSTTGISPSFMMDSLSVSLDNIKLEE